MRKIEYSKRQQCPDLYDVVAELVAHYSLKRDRRSVAFGSKKFSNERNYFDWRGGPKHLLKE